MTQAADRVVDWRGGTLDDLVAMLSGPALAVRIEVMVSHGQSERTAGEVHMIAGGVAEVFAGGLRSEDAMEHLRQVQPNRFLVEPTIPHPETGGLSPAGPEDGTLAERPLATLMRYCEDYVITCLLEVWRGPERATITYRRGEIVSVAVEGSDAPGRLPEVMTWSNGMYRIVLPPLVLPAPARARPPTPDPGRIKSAAGQRPTLPCAPGYEVADDRRSTTPGMPVGVFDSVVRERTTEVGVSTMPLPDASGPTAQPQRPAARPRSTTPGFVAVQVSPETPRRGPVRPTPQRTAARQRDVSGLPVAVHVILGLGLGLAIVGGYWIVQNLLLR